jgi:hypothetical protein
MKKSILLGLVSLSIQLFAQIGAGTPNPQGTFHIDGAQDNPVTGVPSVAQQTNDFTVTSSGNVGIGTVAPNASAALEINTVNKGFLPPRVTLTSSTDAATINAPSTGLTVYHNGNATLEAGLYTNTGTPTAPSWNKGQTIDHNEGGKFYKMIYRGATVDPTKIIQAGLFEWRISTNASFQLLQARLLQAPSGTVTLQGPRIAWTPSIITTAGSNVSWSATDWSTWKQVDYQGSGASHLLYLDCSTTEDFYRVSFYTRLNSYTSLLVEVY